MTVQTVDLGYRPRRWQAECHRARRKHMVLKVHRQAGKSTWAVMETIDRCLVSEWDDYRGGYIAPYYKQAKDIAWGYYKKFLASLPGVLPKEQELQIWMPNGGRISLYGADNPDSLRGIHLNDVIIDEYAQIKPDLFPVILSPALLTRDGGDVKMGTVKGWTQLSKEFNEALRRDPSLYMARNLTWRDTGVFSDEKIAHERSQMSDEQFRQEYENDDSVASEKQIIPMGLVRAALGKHLRAPDYEWAPKILGVDPAYSEVGDRAVIFPRQGLVAFPPIVGRGWNPRRLAETVATKALEWGADAIFVDTGRGEGVINYLRDMKLSPIPVDVGSAPMKPHYANKRVEMWDDGIKPWLLEGGALPDNVQGLVEDLCAPCFRDDSQSGKLMMETADQIKKKGHPSPDLGMALAFTFAAPIRAKPRPEDWLTQRLTRRPRTAIVERDSWESEPGL